MIKYLIEKEFKQIVRNPFIPKLILLFPCMIMILMPWAANLEIKNIRLNIVDNDCSPLSRKLIQKISASTYFRITAFTSTYDEGLCNIESGDADIVLEIPLHFEKDWMQKKTPQFLLTVNAVNGTKGGIGSSYLSSIISDYANNMMAERGIDVSSMQMPIQTFNLYNPWLNYKLFMVPALMVMLLTLVCGALPALNIVGEKEAGTIEQINVTPVGKFTFVFAKLIPYWLIGLVILTIAFVLAWLLYDIFPQGHFLTLYFFSVIFLLLVSGFGLVVSNYSSTLQQAMFVMFFFMLILVLMSGLFTPIHSMPYWAQFVTYVNPLRYFVEVMRSVYLRGGDVADLLPQMVALLMFAVGFNLWAVYSYRKNS